MAKVKSVGGRPSKARVAEINETVIIEALKAYLELGIDFHVQDVATAAGVSKQAIYRRWPKKVDLLIDALEKGMEIFLSGFTVDLPEAPIDILRELMSRLFTGDRIMNTRIALNMYEHSLVEPKFSSNFEEWRRRSIEPVVQAVTRLHQACGLPPETAPDKAQTLVDMFHGIGLRAALTRDMSEVDRAATFDRSWELARKMLLN